ncbi:hypothetical protein J3A83DRAFT_4266976 [Scleroderma citrinum]
MTSMAEVPPFLLAGVPVLQPPHLEGLSDPTLSTEILPGPPALADIQNPVVHKRDPKKSVFVSYLPPSDPGSTYSGLVAGPLTGPEIDGPRRKRARIDKGTANGRAQRANARSLNSSTLPASDPVIPEAPSRRPSVPLILDSDLLLAQPDSDDPSMSLSRANSLPGTEEGAVSFSNTNGRGRSARKDKGKGKETDRSIVKEEPVQVSLSPEPYFGMPNDDHCSSCRSLGALVYCDSCPKAFHLWCLDPPMEAIDLPEGDKWYCPSCTIRKHPPPKPTRSSFLSPLIHHLQLSIPKEFQLPDDIRNFFKDVTTGTNGMYVDSSEVKQLRLNRHGQLEDRDPYRLKDRNGIPVICFCCGKSALPTSVVASTSSARYYRRSTSTVHSATSEAWKRLVSCDYCNLHWHLDCLDPPLTSMPSYGKKWMCPNHIDQVLQPKRRIPKQSVAPVDIMKPMQWNNGNIEVIHPQPAAMTEKLVLDEVLINGRRYRVPERIIMLDFWSKIGKDQHRSHSRDTPSEISSPLTSLSSLDETDEGSRPLSEDLISRDELHAAQLLFDLHHSFVRRTATPAQRSIVQQQDVDRSRGTLVDSSTQTDLELESRPVVPLPRTAEPSDSAKPVTYKRKASSRTSGKVVPEISFPETSSLLQTLAEHSSPTRSKRARVALKQEQDDVSKLAEDLIARPQENVKTAPAQPQRRGRPRRKARQVEKNSDIVPPACTGFVHIAPAPSAPHPPVTPTPATTQVPSAHPVASPVPVRGSASKPAPPTTPKASVTITQSGATSTPTLKIRLPRLSAVSSTAQSSLAPPTSQSPLNVSPAPDVPACIETRPRRSLRRQGSASISVSGTSSTSFTPDEADDAEVAKPSELTIPLRSS